MAKLIGFLLGAFSLISVISTFECLDQVKLEKDLDKPGLEAEEAKEMLLEVPEEQRNTVSVGGVSVAEILSYTYTECSSVALTDRRLVETDLGQPDWSYGFIRENSGVGTFLTTYINKRKESCAKDFYKIFDEAVDDIGSDNEKTIKDLHSARVKSQSIWSSILSPSWLDEIKSSWGQDELFQACAKLIKKLSIAMSLYKGGAVERLHNGDKRKSIKRWGDYLETCKLYTERQCEHQNYPRISDNSAPRRLPKVTPTEESIQLRFECDGIEGIGESDESKRERKKAKKSATGTK